MLQLVVVMVSSNSSSSGSSIIQLMCMYVCVCEFVGGPICVIRDDFIHELVERFLERAPLPAAGRNTFRLCNGHVRYRSTRRNIRLISHIPTCIHT